MTSTPYLTTVGHLPTSSLTRHGAGKPETAGLVHPVLDRSQGRLGQMTLHGVLIDIACSGAKGIARKDLVVRYGHNVHWAIDALVQLKLASVMEMRSWGAPRVFASYEKGGYSGRVTQAIGRAA